MHRLYHNGGTLMVRTVRLAKAARQRSASPVSVALYPKKASSSPSRSDTSCVVASSYRTAFAALGLEGLITRSGESAPGLWLGLGLGLGLWLGLGLGFGFGFGLGLGLGLGARG